MCVRVQEEVRIMLRMSDSVGGGVIGPHDMTPKLVKSTLAKLNALQAHITPWSEVFYHNPRYTTCCNSAQWHVSAQSHVDVTLRPY